MTLDHQASDIQKQAREYIQRKEWNPAQIYLQRLIEIRPSSKDKIYYRLAQAHYKLKNITAAERIIISGLDRYPASYRLLAIAAKVALKQHRWELALKYFTKLNQLRPLTAKEALGLNATFKLSASPLTAPPNTLATEKDCVFKIEIFNNKKTRFDYFLKNTNPPTLFIVFDTITNTWAQPPFAFPLLTKSNVDFIAIRKSERESCYQDLSLDDFHRTIQPLTRHYKQVIAYGSSLGGYCTLYYSSTIKTKVLALAPRIPAHPVFGIKKYAQKLDFAHKPQLPQNFNNEITIVYDPINTLDNTYVTEQATKSCPHARLIKIPYAGHYMPQHLLHAGVLKTLVLDALNGTLKTSYKNKERRKSPQYLLNLSAHCLLRGKQKLALKLMAAVSALITDKRKLEKIIRKNFAQNHIPEDQISQTLSEIL